MRAVIAGVIIAWAARVAAQPSPDMERAKTLYSQANAEMSGGKFAEAARDYASAYDITKDPVLFFKIGSANEKAGRCDLAVVYFTRFLKEASPKAEHAALARERIIACNGVPPDAKSPAKTPEPRPTTPDARAPTQAIPASPVAPPTSPAPAIGQTTVAAHPSHTGAWLMVGGSIAFATAGAVLAYSARSSEQDLRDLYAGVGGNPVVYDAATARRYQDLLDQGHRYEHLSWAGFGVAGACAVGAAILFLRGGEDERVSFAPIVSPHESGLTARLRF
jgi:hypothetical protein